MDSTNIGYFIVLSGAICFFLSIAQAVSNKDKEGKRHITALGVICIIATVLMLIVGFWQIHAVKKEKIVQGKVDSAKDEKIIHLTIGNDSLLRQSNVTTKKLDSAKKSNIEIKDSVKRTNYLLTISQLQGEVLQLQFQSEHKENVALQRQLNSPIIEESNIGYQINPELSFDSIAKHYFFDVTLINNGHGKAQNISVTFNTFDIYGRFIGISQRVYEDSSLVLSEGMTYSFGAFPKFPRDCYILIDVKYKNIFGESMKEYIKVYNAGMAYVGKSIPLVTRQKSDEIKNTYLLERDLPHQFKDDK